MMNTLPEYLQPKNAYSGSIDPLFLCADNMTLSRAQSFGGTALSASEKLRLVKASKSRTDDERLNVLQAKVRFSTDSLRLSHNHVQMLNTGEIPEPHAIEYQPSQQHTPLNSPGCRAVVEFKDWADEWRLRTEVDGQNLQPPEQVGERISKMLSHRGASKIAESCAFMSVVHGGYKTFVTGTFTDSVRESIAAGETTIQKEVSRTMNALQKMYRRGWTTRNGERVAGNSEGLPYCWVVEVPKNKQGEDNPHIHLLLGWRVAYKHFAEWSARIEKIWSNGYFHLEKIKDSTCAGAYMAKAAGYLSKAQGDDTQGTVTGNRYGISAVARAPGWALYAKSQLHIASQLIVDVYDHLTQQYGDDYRTRKRLNRALDNTPKAKKRVRHAIGKKLAKVRAAINAIPIRCNKYQAVIKGRGNAFRFFSWMKNEEDNGNGEWLPKKDPGMAWITGKQPVARDTLYFSKVHDLIDRRKLRRRLTNKPPWLHQSDEEWHCVKYDYINSAYNESLPVTTGSDWNEYQTLLLTTDDKESLLWQQK